MGSSKRVAVVAVVVAFFTSVTACSSDDDSSGSNSTTGGSQPSGSVNKEYETWCSSVEDLVDQSSPNDLSEVGDLAAFSQALTSLSANAPAPIESQMQTLATATATKLEAVQQDPTATLPSDVAQQAQSASDDVSTFVSDNCGGVQLPTIDL
jgi:hypothetical protein